MTLYIDTNTQSNQLFDDGSKAVWDNGASIVLRDSVEAVPFPSLNNPVVIHDFQFTAKRMGAAPTITASFYYPTCLDKEWTYKVFAVFGGERYFIKQIPTSGIANTEGMYQHSIELVSERVLLDNVYFYDVVNSEVGADKPVSNSSKFSFFGDINEFAKRINESLKYRNLDYTVVVDDGITSAAYTVAFDNKVISEVLQEVYNVYNLPYYFDGKTIHIGYTNNAITETFRYGVDDALLSINKENANYKVVTAVSGSGSEDNIPYYYPNDYESKEEVEAHGGTWINPSSTLQPPIYRESLGKERFYQAKNYVYPIPGSSETYTFDNLYEEGRPKEHIIDFSDIKPTITGIKNALGYGIDTFLEFAYDAEDNDEVDEEGNYLHPYFFAKLRKFDGANGFNLFDHAIDEAQMSISMTSGSCGSCEFIIGVGEDTQKNLVQVDGAGNLVRDENGNVRCGRDGMPVEEPQDRQNDTMNYEVWIALKKDVNTFGVVMPNATNKYRPSVTDTFVILHIDLPKAYVLAAEERLKDALIAYMADNNSEKFNFSIAFSRIYFAEHPEVLALLNENARVQLEYNGDYIELYVSSFSYTMSKDTPLPEIKVELADTLTISQNALQTAINDLKGSGFGGIGVGASGDILKLGLAYFLRKDMNDRTRGKLSSDVGFEVGRYVSGASGATMFLDKQTGKTTAEMDKLYVRVKAYFETLEIVNVNSVGGKQIISPAGSMKCVKVENDSTKSYYRCYVLSEQDGEKIENRFHVGDQVYSQMFNAKPGVSNKVSNHYWWRLCVGVGEDYIDISKTDCDSDSDAPAVGDIMCQRGNRNDVDRQNFIELSSVDAYSPNITLFQGVNSYSLVDKDIISYGVDKTTNQAFMNIYGNMYVGDRENNSYLKYSIEDGLQLKGTLDVGTKFGDKTLQEMLDKYAYLGRAFKENTKIVGGVIQTSSTVLGYTGDSGEYVVMSGTNGLVGDKGLKSIAFWAGGDMVDIFDYWDKGNNTFNVPAGVRPATALDRMDGTGYRANGALWWENDGNVHANPLSFFVGENTVGALFAAFQIYPNNSSNPLYIIPHAPFTQFMLSTPASAGTDDYIFTPTDEALKLTRKKSTNANFWASGDIVAYAAGGGDITLPIASANALGAVKIGDGLSIAADGTLSATNTGSIAGIESSGAGNVVTSLDVISGGKVLLYTKGLTALTTTDYATTLDTRYVKKSGDTMTGALTATKFTSNIATGTAPLSVSSTTVCANLNADMLDGIHYQNILERNYSGYTVGDDVSILSGWFRIGETIGSNGQGVSFILFLTRSYGHNSNETYTFSISIVYNGSINITQLSGYANSQLITKIRIDWLVNNIAYIDIYITESSLDGFFWTTIGSAKSYTSWIANPTLAGTAYEFTTINGLKSDKSISSTSDIIAYSTGSGDIILPIASSSALGAIKVGNGLSIDSNGVLSATGAGSIGNVVVDGTGNAITTASASGTTLTLTKGNSFLPLSGGTLTGSLTIANSNYNQQLILKSTGVDSAENQAGIVFTSSGDSWQDLRIRGERFDDFLTGYGLVLSGGSVTKDSDASMYLYNTGRYISKVATGTKPIDVVSTTLCTNLNADMLDGKHNTEFLYYGGDNRNLGSGSPFDTVTTWATADNIGNGAKLLYNSNGAEYSILFSLRPSNYRYGTILKWGYRDTYIYIARKNEDTWQSTNWEKISSGYSDTTGKLQTAITLWGQSFNGAEDVNGNIIASSNQPYILFDNKLNKKVGDGSYIQWNSTDKQNVRLRHSWHDTEKNGYGLIIENGINNPYEDDCYLWVKQGSIRAAKTISSDQDVIAYSTGTSNAPFKYWRPYVSTDGVISWSNTTSDSKIDDVDLATPAAKKAATLITAGVNTSTDIGVVGTPSVDVSATNGKISFTFHKLKGATGASISKVELSGSYNSASEGTNTYNVYVGSNNVGSFKVTNGKQGATGSMSAASTVNLPSGGTVFTAANATGKQLGVKLSGGNGILGWNTQTNGMHNLYLNDGAPSGIAVKITNYEPISGSDIRIKSVFYDVPNVLDKIEGISAFYYTLKEDENKILKIGVSAQAVREVFPEAITLITPDGHDAYYGVNYMQLLTAVGINGLKELHALVKSQQSKIDELEKRLAAIES